MHTNRGMNANKSTRARRWSNVPENSALTSAQQRMYIQLVVARSCREVYAIFNFSHEYVCTFITYMRAQ